jgi:hypothetical protein
MLDQAEPISSVSDVRVDRSKVGSDQRELFNGPVAWHIFELDSEVIEEFGLNDTRDGFKGVGTGSDSLEVAKRLDNADQAVTAHPQVSDVIEKDNSGRIFRVGGRQEMCSDHHFRAAWFQDDRGSKSIEVFRDRLKPFVDIFPLRCGPSGDDGTSRFAGGMGVDDTKLQIVHGLAIKKGFWERMIMQELCVERAKTDRYGVNTPVSLGKLWLSGYIFPIEGRKA